MPIDSLHPDYNDAWEKVTTDAVNGNVKNYIPRLVNQEKPQYDAYTERATYFNVTRRTASALTGALLRKPYDSTYDTDSVNVYGNQSFDEFVHDVITGLMTRGRIGVLCDYNDTSGEPYLVCYPNSTIVNWRMDNNCNTELVVLREDKYEPSPDDPYKLNHVLCYRELLLVDGVYVVRIWKQELNSKWSIVEEMIPSFRGSPLTVIPFTFINTYDTTPDVTEPTLYNLAQINISHFRTSADIEHAAHFTALPQPWLAGNLHDDTTQLGIGTYDVWQLEEGSQVGYLEFGGAGIKSLQDIQRHKEEQMSAIGSRLLQDKKGVESVEALRIRQGSESASLVTLASSFEKGMTLSLMYYDMWKGGTGDVEFTANKDFSPATLSPQELKALMDAYLTGTISQDTFLTALFEGELVENIEEEKQRLGGSNNVRNNNITTIDE